MPMLKRRLCSTGRESGAEFAAQTDNRGSGRGNKRNQHPGDDKWVQEVATVSTSGGQRGEVSQGRETDAESGGDRQGKPTNRTKLKVDRVDKVDNSLTENITVKKKVLTFKDMLKCMIRDGRQRVQGLTVNEQANNPNFRQEGINVTKISFTKGKVKIILLRF